MQSPMTLSSQAGSQDYPAGYLGLSSEATISIYGQEGASSHIVGFGANTTLEPPAAARGETLYISSNYSASPFRHPSRPSTIAPSNSGSALTPVINTE